MQRRKFIRRNENEISIQMIFAILPNKSPRKQVMLSAHS